MSLDDLKTKDPYQRREAIKALEKSADKSIIPVFIDMMLTDSSAYVRRAAAAAFQGRLADKGAVPALIKALNDQNQYVRGAAAAALGKIKDTRAVKPLCKALTDPHAHVRWAATSPLAQIQDKAAIPSLKRLVEDPNELQYVKSAAAIAISQLEGENA